jgi:cell division protease FtsH
MNEAAINATRQNRTFIKKEDVDKAFVKVGIGTEKKSRLVPEKERRITAYHEAGHAILFHVLDQMGPVYTVSIIPTGVGAAGYTMPLPENDNVFNTKQKMMQEIQVDFGGRIAEELIFGDVTTGASQDIRQASKTARDMVVRYGFSERVGLINYETAEDDEVFVGRDIGHEAHYSENVKAMIDEEVKKIIDECYAKAKNIILENMDVLHAAANLLLEKEKITGEEFVSLFKTHKTDGENLS